MIGGPMRPGGEALLAIALAGCGGGASDADLGNADLARQVSAAEQIATPLSCTEEEGAIQGRT
jgi:hypothetical protein